MRPLSDSSVTWPRPQSESHGPKNKHTQASRVCKVDTDAPAFSAYDFIFKWRKPKKLWAEDNGEERERKRAKLLTMAFCGEKAACCLRAEVCVDVRSEPREVGWWHQRLRWRQILFKISGCQGLGFDYICQRLLTKPWRLWLITLRKRLRSWAALAGNRHTICLLLLTTSINAVHHVCYVSSGNCRSRRCRIVTTVTSAVRSDPSHM